MSAWMEYLYQQQPKPTNATGVPVTLSVFDPNNNTYTVATTTSDADGNFAVMWTPPVPGVYTIKASFDGTNSYFSSYGTTPFAVVQPPAASPIASSQPTTPSPQVTSTPVQTSPSPSQAPQPTSGIPIMTYVAIAAAVVIIAVIAAALVLRRRK